MQDIKEHNLVLFSFNSKSNRISIPTQRKKDDYEVFNDTKSMEVIISPICGPERPLSIW